MTYSAGVCWSHSHSTVHGYVYTVYIYRMYTVVHVYTTYSFIRRMYAHHIQHIRLICDRCTCPLIESLGLYLPYMELSTCDLKQC